MAAWIAEWKPPSADDVQAFIDLSTAATYALPGHIKAAQQVTVHPGPRGYRGVLNATGEALLLETWRRLKDPAELRARLMGKICKSESGRMIEPGGAISLHSLENRTFQGTITETFGQAGRFTVGKPLETSCLVLYEIDSKGYGWGLTSTGSIYLLDAPTP